ncbi:hypothetical protein SASPL_129601 [Salvia splendens]|uniref:FAD-dependent protein C-terminal domain-containing protein n=1 Tax=Salvia splendens TaxID=180675 RepID=A0A8X8XDM3_SALSN|nr:hypothetical protein SASPL_129601 [Salvia splendens]
MTSDCISLTVTQAFKLPTVSKGTWSDGKLVTIRFGMRVDDLLVNGDTVSGVKISDSRGSFDSSSQKLGCDAIVLAVGLRVEHPQELINDIQYSGLANEVRCGRGKVPVADYQVARYVEGTDTSILSNMEPVTRSCYSFCMCPGGQVGKCSTSSNVSSKDFEDLNLTGLLAGVEFQRTFERKAALMGGGDFVVPVQTVTDFLDNRLLATSVPPSSYRLGVKPANLHELYPLHITEALQRAISMFNEELPGFISSSALLHGVETRTSSPIQITHRSDTWESTSLKGLYPVGEEAGYVIRVPPRQRRQLSLRRRNTRLFRKHLLSAAVDGMHAGFAVARNLGLYDSSLDSVVGKAQNVGFVKY